jgi:periplasmic protein TonB
LTIHLAIIASIFIFGICPSAFGQKCKEKSPPVLSGKIGGPQITSKPQPEYTDEARRQQISGTIVIRAIFHSSGKVRDVCWVSSLPYGLTENAIKAAYQIRFEPIKKDGRPITMKMFVEYNFQLY